MPQDGFDTHCAKFYGANMSAIAPLTDGAVSLMVAVVLFYSIFSNAKVVYLTGDKESGRGHSTARPKCWVTEKSRPDSKVTADSAGSA